MVLPSGDAAGVTEAVARIGLGTQLLGSIVIVVIGLPVLCRSCLALWALPGAAAGARPQRHGAVAAGLLVQRVDPRAVHHDLLHCRRYDSAVLLQLLLGPRQDGLAQARGG